MLRVRYVEIRVLHNVIMRTGRIVDLKLSDEVNSPTTAVLNARIRYITEAGGVRAKWVPLNITLGDIDNDSVTHKFVNSEDMPSNDVQMHPTDGAAWLSNIHDHFESGNGSAEALNKAHQRMSAFGVDFAAAGSAMTVSGLTTSIRNHMNRHGTNDCGCEDQYDKKACSGSKSRQRIMRRSKKKNTFDMSALNEAVVSTDRWFASHLSELRE